MTENEWKSVDEALKVINLYPVELEADGYRVSLMLRPISRWRNAILFEINGEFKSEWYGLDCEERRRFFRRKKTCMLKNKDFQRMGISNIHQIEELRKEYTIDVYSRAWTDFKAMKKHFTNNNKNITLLQA